MRPPIIPTKSKAIDAVHFRNIKESSSFDLEHHCQQPYDRSPPSPPATDDDDDDDDDQNNEKNSSKVKKQVEKEQFEDPFADFGSGKK